MKQHEYYLVAGGICLVILFTSIGMIKAGGFIRITGSGDVYRWDASAPVPFNPDQGVLGILSNADAVNMVNDNFLLWGAGNIPTSSLSFTNAGQLTMDVSAAADFAALNGVVDGISPIIFDEDGELTAALGLDDAVIGFATPDVLSATAPFTIKEGLVFFNGDHIDGDTQDGNEITVEAFGGVMAHEFGHFLNVSHSQVNGHYYIGNRWIQRRNA